MECFGVCVRVVKSPKLPVRVNSGCNRHKTLYFVAGDWLYRIGGCDRQAFHCYTDLFRTDLRKLVEESTTTTEEKSSVAGLTPSADTLPTVDWVLVKEDLTVGLYHYGGNAVRLSRDSVLVIGSPIANHEPLAYVIRLDSVTGCQNIKTATAAADDGKPTVCTPCADSTRLGYDCELSELRVAYDGVCNHHGDLDPLHRCVCFKGFYGAHCQLGAADCDCHGRGSCDAKSTCRCDAGWTGESCQIPLTCPRNCCNRGVCQDSICHCQDPYVSSSCLLTQDDIVAFRRDRLQIIDDVQSYLNALTSSALNSTTRSTSAGEPSSDEAFRKLLLEAKAVAETSISNPDHVENYFVTDASCSFATPQAVDVPAQQYSQTATALNLVQPLGGLIASGQTASQQLGYDVYAAMLAHQETQLAQRAAEMKQAQKQTSQTSVDSTTGIGATGQGATGQGQGTTGTYEDVFLTQQKIRYPYMHGFLALTLSFGLVVAMYLTTTPRQHY
ncbi:putative transmembrane protein [Gregarina niphandrodes]|uniref:Transmembrane protein n=1 Tax=Gregarina niphandrodes TaxID=110365 RepID=A0A023B770_GRENI|nr:putative transmembrane protein [Gregarina niphandrodes]EZG67010.1 putative transmembrane protein [Gregarina niphandrodes]|eukprot:XP_011130397.1 putative transmembrane protein [Gregarina niphandrodes]